MLQMSTLVVHVTKYANASLKSPFKRGRMGEACSPATFDARTHIKAKI